MSLVFFFDSYVLDIHLSIVFFFNVTPTTEIYTYLHTLSLHDALPIFITVRFIGFLFDISRLVREYVSILYLSYFNTALVFLPIVIIMAFSSKRLTPSYVLTAILMLAIIFFFQFLRAGDRKSTRLNSSH